MNNLRISENLEEVFIQSPIVIFSQRTSNVVCLAAVVVYAGDQNDSDEVIGSGFAPLIEQLRQERMDNLLSIPLTVPRKVPQLATDLNKERYFG